MEYNILDFSKWKDEGEFRKMFRKLIDGLNMFYKVGVTLRPASLPGILQK